eukprot:1258164-Pleurochrysis_carterae.AAC.1
MECMCDVVRAALSARDLGEGVTMSVVCCGMTCAPGASIGAKLADGQQRILEGGGAPHAAQQDRTRYTRDVHSKKAEVSDRGALFGQLVDPHDIFSRWSHVDEIGLCRVYVPGAAAVDHEGEATATAAPLFESVVPAREQGFGRGCRW